MTIIDTNCEMMYVTSTCENTIQSRFVCERILYVIPPYPDGEKTNICRIIKERKHFYSVGINGIFT